MFLNKFLTAPFWQSGGLFLSRFIIAGVFAMAVAFKFMSMSGTAAQIASVGLPFALVLAWLAAIFEVLVVLAFLSGAYFRQFAFLTLLYILFLGIMFHGPNHWSTNQDEFGFFIDHLTFAAGLIALIVTGPGKWSLKNGLS